MSFNQFLFLPILFDSTSSLISFLFSPSHLKVTVDHFQSAALQHKYMEYGKLGCIYILVHGRTACGVCVCVCVVMCALQASAQLGGSDNVIQQFSNRPLPC